MIDPHQTAITIPPRAAYSSVRRAIDRFRRGDPVLIGRPADGAGPTLLAFGLETLDDPGLLQLRAAGPVWIVVSGERAVALGLAASAAAAVILPLPPTLSLSSIAPIADPVAPAAPPLLGGFGQDHPAAAEMAAGLLLAKLAGLMPVALVAEAAARPADTPCVEAAAVAAFARESSRWLVQVADARVPLADAEDCRIVAFRPVDGGPEALAIIIGSLDPAQPVLARIHSACFTGDLLGSLRCDCGEQLRGAIRALADEGSGVIIYLPQEGRGIGLVNKLRAYDLQDAGLDTVDANLRLGFAPDERSYAAAGEILRRIGVTRIRLLTNNPGKLDAIERLGVQIVERVPHSFPPNPHNQLYLQTKALRDGHNF